MRYFYKVADGVKVDELMHSIHRQPLMWNEHRFRTSFKNTPHVDVDDILLKFTAPENCTIERVVNDTEPVWYMDNIRRLPEAKDIVLNLMRYVKAYKLERLIITRIKPGGRILPHADKDGDYVQAPDIARYHVVLQGLPGSLYHCGDETVNMKTGEVYWFNAHEIHSIENNSVDDRIHLLVDVRICP